MSTPKLYIIAGCNGAGKTTASMSVLPEVLDCREFVITNAPLFTKIKESCQNRKK